MHLLIPSMFFSGYDVRYGQPIAYEGNALEGMELYMNSVGWKRKSDTLETMKIDTSYQGYIETAYDKLDRGKYPTPPFFITIDSIEIKDDEDYPVLERPNFKIEYPSFYFVNPLCFSCKKRCTMFSKLINGELNTQDETHLMSISYRGSDMNICWPISQLLSKRDAENLIFNFELEDDG